ncbi:hypothetical protein CNO34_004677 [Escherichia coli]|nr:hypothetical protein [Escherichia coli]
MYNCGESYSEYDISLSDDENYDDDYYRERPCPGEVFGYDNSEDNDEAASDYALKINEALINTGGADSKPINNRY